MGLSSSDGELAKMKKAVISVRDQIPSLYFLGWPFAAAAASGADAGAGGFGATWIMGGACSHQLPMARPLLFSCWSLA